MRGNDRNIDVNEIGRVDGLCGLLMGVRWGINYFWIWIGGSIMIP